jgi:pimeloyl-ACP methyl ester carboxylesterase
LLCAGNRARVPIVDVRDVAGAPYQALQAATPQTIGYALTDSPVGRPAWIAERFAQWVDPRSPISDDRVLTDVSLYWLTATAASSARLHHDARPGPAPCPAPLGVAVFAHDLTRSVRPLVERRSDVRHWSESERGGHFAAMEVPDLFAEDVRAFFLALAKDGAPAGRD